MDYALTVDVRDICANRRQKAIRIAGLALLEQIRWSATPTEPARAKDIACLQSNQPAIVPFVLINGTDVIVHAAWLELGETLTHRYAEIRTVQSYDLKFAEVQRFDVSTVHDARAANKVWLFTVVSLVNCVCVLRSVRLCDVARC